VTGRVAKSGASKAGVLLRERDHLAWQVNAGLRLLSAITPQYGEAKWYEINAQRHAVGQLVAAGKLLPTDPYNTVSRNPTGKTRYVTNFGMSEGRTWRGALPGHVRSFETIELDLSNGVERTEVATAVISAARSISAATGREIAAKIAKLRGPPAPIRLSDLSIFHTGGQTAFQSEMQTRTGILLIEILEHALGGYSKHANDPTALANYFNEYEERSQASCRTSEEPGLGATCVLLLMAICRSALPAWPFGRGPWSCGVPHCNHVLCNLEVPTPSRSSHPLAAFGGGMRDFFASTLKNTISLGGLLRSVASEPTRLRWLEAAAGSLLQKAERTRDALQSPVSFDHFYALHHEIAVVSPAALLAYQTLAQFGGDRRSEFQLLENASEEIKARSMTALVADFDNSVDVTHFLSYRRTVGELQLEKGVDAGQRLLRKLIHDETLLPAEFEHFLSGATNVLNITSPFPGQGTAARIRNSILAAMQKPRRYVLG
jgi:hypothetical protein